METLRQKLEAWTDRDEAVRCLSDNLGLKEEETTGLVQEVLHEFLNRMVMARILVRDQEDMVRWR